jgi:hypothetical protein
MKRWHHRYLKAWGLYAAGRSYEQIGRAIGTKPNPAVALSAIGAQSLVRHGKCFVADRLGGRFVRDVRRRRRVRLSEVWLEVLDRPALMYGWAERMAGGREALQKQSRLLEEQRADDDYFRYGSRYPGQ